MILTDFISFGLGIVLRLWNEHSKQKAADHKMQMAVASGNMELLKQQHERVAGSTFLQTLMMVMILVALGVLVAWPLLAVFLDVPLFVLIEYAKETGFWIFKGTKQVAEFMSIDGLYLPVEIQVLIIESIKFVFGAVVGGVGRR